MSLRCHDNTPQSDRRGLTLLELLLSMSVLVMIVGALGALANGVQLGFEHGEGYGTTTQHARVVLDRITRAANGAMGNESFPGYVVLTEVDGGALFPDTLVVWRPAGQAANPSGLPLFSELVVFCPDPLTPNQLMEITAPGDTRTVPAVSDAAAWAAEIGAMKTSTASQKVRLTTLLRTASVSGASQTKWRGAIRFQTRLAPSAEAWAQYKAGTLAWNQLRWVQGLFGSQFGMRQSWMRVEFQLNPQPRAAVSGSAAMPPVPYFGSAAIYYQLTRSN